MQRRIAVLFSSLVVCVLMFFSSGTRSRVWAAFPQSFTYQGSLKQSGVPVNGTATIQISITNAAGTSYWDGPSQSVTVTEGLYRLDVSPTITDWSSLDAYIQTKVNGVVLLPREKLNATPYAWIAKDLAPGTTISYALASATSSFAVLSKELQAGSTVQGNLFVGNQMVLPNGLPNRPAVALGGDWGWGMFRIGNSLSFSTNGLERVDIDANGNHIPALDNVYSSGRSTSRWSTVYSANGVTATSSSKFKNNIREILGDGKARPLGEVVEPSFKSFTTKNGHPTVERAKGKDEPLDVPRGIVFNWKVSSSTAAASADVIGFMGDDLPVEAHVLNDDGTRDPSNFYVNAVVGLLCARVRSQDAQLKDFSARLAVLEKRLR